jgi:hypothetical protein
MPAPSDRESQQRIVGFSAEIKEVSLFGQV